ncbi:MAG: phosphoribosyltransferase family protein [bacterium]|nr:phosphoribosyltransferase family protein [bacterium]
MFKYKFSADLSRFFGELMFRQAEKFRQLLSWDIIYLVPVPLHKARLKYRGFNQSLLLAEYLSKRFKRSCVLDCLHRLKNSERQAKLGKLERQINLQGAFCLNVKNPNLSVSGRRVVLIDDVATTCSTLNECAKTLKSGGAKSVTGLVLARGHLFC